MAPLVTVTNSGPVGNAGRAFLINSGNNIMNEEELNDSNHYFLNQGASGVVWLWSVCAISVSAKSMRSRKL